KQATRKAKQRRSRVEQAHEIVERSTMNENHCILLYLMFLFNDHYFSFASAPSKKGGQYYRTTSTGNSERFNTPWATLPSRARSKNPRPWLPTTIKSACCSSATWQMVELA